MNEFYLSSTGQSTEKWLDQTKRKREALPYPPIKIIFPSLKTVRATVMGERVSDPIISDQRNDAVLMFIQGWWYHVLLTEKLGGSELPKEAIS